MPGRELTDRQPLPPEVPPDRLEQLHVGPHLGASRPLVNHPRATVHPLRGGARSSRHSGVSPQLVGPDRTATVEPDQTPTPKPYNQDPQVVSATTMTATSGGHGVPEERRVYELLEPDDPGRAAPRTPGGSFRRRLRLVGQDIGGIVAFAYARIHPDQVERLVLLELAVPGLTTERAAAVGGPAATLATQPRSRSGAHAQDPAPRRRRLRRQPDRSRRQRLRRSTEHLEQRRRPAAATDRLATRRRRRRPRPALGR
jgi:hypothetical protein